MPTPRPDRTFRGAHDTAFWSHCDQGELAIQRCAGCETYAWPPVEACGACGASDLVWRPLSGRARLRSHCTFERQYYPECPPPWTTVLVELEEGPLFISNAPSVPDDQLKEDMPLAVQFLACEDKHGEFALPVFRAA